MCFVTALEISQAIEHVSGKGVEIIEGPVSRAGVHRPMTSVYIPDPDGTDCEVEDDECIGDAKCMSGASDASAKGMELAPNVDMGSRRICLRLPGDGHGRETASHEWRGAGPRIWRTTSNDGWPHRPQSTVRGLTRGEGRAVSSK